MATHEKVMSVTMEADQDMSDTAVAAERAQYHFVVTTTTENQVTLAGAGVEIFGIMYGKPNNAGIAAEVAIYGRAKVILAATVAINVDITPNATGEAVAATTGDIIAAKTMTGGVSGDVVECMLRPSKTKAL